MRGRVGENEGEGRRDEWMRGEGGKGWRIEKEKGGGVGEWGGRIGRGVRNE